MQNSADKLTFKLRLTSNGFIGDRVDVLAIAFFQNFLSRIAYNSGIS